MDGVDDDVAVGVFVGDDDGAVSVAFEEVEAAEGMEGAFGVGCFFLVEFEMFEFAVEFDGDGDVGGAVA